MPQTSGRSIVSGHSSGDTYPGIWALVSYPGILAFACIRASGNDRGIPASGHPLAIRALQEYPGESTRLMAMAMATGHGRWRHGLWPWPLAMGIRAIWAIRASGQSNSAIRAILAIRAIQASGHPGIRKPPGAPMGHRGPDPIDRPGDEVGLWKANP